MAHKPSVKMVGIFGAKRSGKSTGAKKDFINKIMNQSNVFGGFIFDTLDEYDGEAGFKRAGSLKEVINLVKNGWNNGFKIAYAPPKGDRVKQLNDFCDLILKIMRPYYDGKDTRQILLVVEELNESFPNSGGANLPKGADGFGELCSRGGHYGVNVIGLAQRPAEVHGRFRGQLDTIRSYRLAFLPDIKTIESMLPRGENFDFFNLEAHHFVQIEGSTITTGVNKL